MAASTMPCCPKCSGKLYSVTDHTRNLIVYCRSRKCDFARVRPGDTPYKEITLQSARMDGSKFRTKTPKRKGRGIYQHCRVTTCETPVEATSTSGMCRDCWSKSNQWRNSGKNTPAPFITHPEDAEIAKPRLIVNPLRLPGVKYGDQSNKRRSKEITSVKSADSRTTQAAS